MNDLPALEAIRCTQQAILDAGKSKPARNALGQFATPTALARDILNHALSLFDPKEKVRFLDPAIGTGSFFSALLAELGETASTRMAHALGFEIDPHYGLPAQALWAETSPRLDIQIQDFTRQRAPTPAASSANLLICNPPYVRHHHLGADTKARLQSLSAQAAGMALSGLAGLYAHFMALAHPWMAPQAVACWLIPSEFMDVNYGREVKRYLRERVTLLRIHRFDPNDAQFDDALVSSAVVWLRNAPPPPNHVVEFTEGGSHRMPRIQRNVALNELSDSIKWTRFPAHAAQPALLKATEEPPRLKDFFDIRRGIATGDNAFFILPADQVIALGLPWSQMKPILPGPRYLSDDRIEANSAGHPLVSRSLFLVDCRLPESLIEAQYPSLWAYLQSGREAMLKRYICSHRSPWYLQENRPPAPLLCTYMGRNDSDKARPFRFILNRSRAVVANTYLNLYPKPHVAQRLAEHPELLEALWSALNRLSPAHLLTEGRVYGGGLHKIEPKELAQVAVEEIATLLHIDMAQDYDLFGQIQYT